MSGRGRGAAPKRGAGPNLALSGVREGQSKASGSDRKSQEASRSRGRGRGRGGRGGGRGGNAGFRDKPALIQSEGIFSEGLSAIDRPKKEREQLPSFRIPRTRDDVKTMDDVNVGKSSFKGWEELWESDGDDEAELREMFNDSFISDLKRGDRMPMVLPVKDEAQFSKLLLPHIKKELFAESEDELMDVNNDTINSEKKFNNDISAKHLSDRPTLIHSRRAAKYIANLEGTQDMVFLQLPSVVNILSHLSEKETELPAMETEATPDRSADDDVLPPLPAGRKIGKIQITKSGRTLLQIGSYTMDVTLSGSSGQQENMVLLETSESAAAPGGPFGRADVKSMGRNAVYHVGTVKHHLTASLDWEAVQEKDTQQNLVEDDEEVVISAREANSLRKEIEALNKEAELWRQDALKWAAPLNQKD